MTDAALPAPEQPNLSALLQRLIDEHPEDRIGPVALADRLGDRALAGLLLLFGLFNLLPLPPGSTFITGIPLLLLSGQLALGYSRPWFPKTLRRRAMTKAELGAVLAKFLRWERWIEKLVKPRQVRLVEGGAARVIGAICLLLSVVLILPIPLGNHLPALSISVFALAIVYRDGVAAIVAGVLTVVSLFVVWGMLFAAITAATYVARNFFGL